MRVKNLAPSAPSLHRSSFALKPEEEKGLAPGPTGSQGLSGAGCQRGDPEIRHFSHGPVPLSSSGLGVGGRA